MIQWWDLAEYIPVLWTQHQYGFFKPARIDADMVESSVLRTCFARLLPQLRFVAIAQSNLNLRL